MTFWHNRWLTQEIGWHQIIYNDLLVKYWPTINIVEGGNVFVPLCGKSHDMFWLAEQGYIITGIEMVEQAIQAFFEENELEFNISEINKQIAYSSPPFTIFKGNLFDLESNTIQADAWYDRAAMIAIHPSTRMDYVNQIYQQTKSGAIGLLITFSYPQGQIEGPPFALHDEDVESLFSDRFEIECLEKVYVEDDDELGLANVTSSVFKIIRN